MGSAHPGGEHEHLPNVILTQSKSSAHPPIYRMINVEYRLVRAPPLHELGNAFPSALLDGLAVIHYLIFSLNFHPRNILLSGDSAGGNIVLSLTRYLRDAPIPEGKEVDGVKSLLPGAMILESPWCDVGSTHIPERAGPECSFVRNANTDIVGRYRTSSFLHPFSFLGTSYNE